MEEELASTHSSADSMSGSSQPASSSSNSSPPPKRKKVSASSRPKSVYKHVKKLRRGRKGKKRLVASSFDSSDSENGGKVVLKKFKRQLKGGRKRYDGSKKRILHKITSPKPNSSSEKSTKHHPFVDVFMTYYSDLVTTIQSSLINVANKLVSKNVISTDLHTRIVKSSPSECQRMTSEMLLHVKDQISVEHNKLREFVEVIQEEQHIASITEKLKNAIERYNTVAQQMHAAPTLNEKSSVAFSRYKTYLQSYYSRDPIASDDKLSIAPCGEFIKLTLVSGTHQKDTSKSRSLELNDILTADSPFVLVEGPPGIGKSTLCWELCRQWDTLKSLQGFKLVLQLKLRDRRVQNATTLNEIFYHRDAELCKSVVSEVFACEGEGVLLIFDGFDELSSSIAGDSSSLIMELISGTCLPRATRLVTSRPSVHYGKAFPQKYRRAEICGFTDEYKEKFAEVSFKSKPEVLSHFKEFIFSNPIINSLMYIPLNCAIIAQVYEDIRKSEKRLPKTMTQLYTILIRTLIKRHMIEKGKWDEHFRVPDNLKDLPNEVIAYLKVVSKLAYEGLFKSDVQLVFSDSEVGEGFQHLGLLTETKEMYVCEGARTSYSFLHLSIQEFLAAWHISQDKDLITKMSFKINPTKSKRFMDASTIERFSTLVRFLSGMIGCSKLYVKWWKRLLGCSKVIRYEGGCEGYHHKYLFQCFHEAQDADNFVSILKENDLSTEASLNISRSTDNPLDAYAFGYCMANIPLDYSISFDIQSIDTFLLSLKKHAGERGSKIRGKVSYISLSANDHMSKYTELTKLLDGSEKLSLYIKDIEDSNITSVERLISSSLLHNSLSLTFKEYCKNDYLVYQKINGLIYCLCISGKDCTDRGTQVLLNLISSCSGLNSVDLYFSSLFANQSIVDQLKTKASSSTLRINIQFTNWFFQFDNLYVTVCYGTNAGKLHNHLLDLQRHLKYMCYNFASKTNTSTAQKVKIHFKNDIFPYYFLIENFVTLLNMLRFRCTHLQLRILDDIAYDRTIIVASAHCRIIARALRKDPDVALSSLRKSESLRDLRHLSTHWTSKLYSYTMSRKCQSCPDLSEIQSLHKLHPRLYKPLRCDQLRPLCRFSDDESTEDYNEDYSSSSEPDSSDEDYKRVMTPPPPPYYYWGLEDSYTYM